MTKFEIDNVCRLITVCPSNLSAEAGGKNGKEGYADPACCHLLMLTLMLYMLARAQR